MLVHDKKISGSTSYVERHLALRTIAGSSLWFTEYKPVRFLEVQTFHQLLFLFFIMVYAFSLKGLLSAS